MIIKQIVKFKNFKFLLILLKIFKIEILIISKDYPFDV